MNSRQLLAVTLVLALVKVCAIAAAPESTRESNGALR